MVEVNGARGEVALKVGGVDLVIAATMSGLSAVSTRLECKSMAGLFERLSGLDPEAVTAAIELLAVKGDGKKAASKFKLAHFKEVAVAVNSALAHQFVDDDQGNGEAAKNETE